MKFGQWLGLIATAAALLLLCNLRAVVIQLFAAVVLAMALCTLVGVVRRRTGCSRPLAVLATVLGLLVVAAITLAAVVPPFLHQFQELLRQLPAAAELAVRLLHQGMDASSRMLYGREALQWLQRLTVLINTIASTLSRTDSSHGTRCARGSRASSSSSTPRVRR